MQFTNLCNLINKDKFAGFQVDKFKFTLNRKGEVIWVVYDDVLHGLIRLETRQFTRLYRGLPQAKAEEVTIRMMEIEADPAEAAKADGILTGRCSCCGRPLTDEQSIRIGVGPKCLKKAGWI